MESQRVGAYVAFVFVNSISLTFFFLIKIYIV